jgi:ferritin-like metal-binding protein YciE
MPMNNLQELFIHELGDLYDAEQRILQILPNLASESADPQVKQAYQAHEQETRQQIQNLEQVYQLLGQPPKRIPCTAVEGMKQEHDSFLKDNPADIVLTLFDLGAAFKTGHYEIASYLGLIEKAQLMGLSQAVPLLRQNLQQEEAMAQRVQQLSRQLGQQQIGQMGQMGASSYQPPVTP